MHDVTPLGITAEDVGDYFTESLGVETLIDIFDSVVYVLF